jgi:8-oxo-dGTP diphosphatase
MSDDRSDRLYPKRPLVGVGAVVWNGEAVLLERRGRAPAQGTWALPGGLIELGETAEAAVAREVREECGIDVRPGPILGLFEPLERDLEGRIRYQYVVIDFLAHYVSGELAVGDDAADARWVAPADLDQYELLPLARRFIERALTLVQNPGLSI